VIGLLAMLLFDALSCETPSLPEVDRIIILEILIFKVSNNPLNIHEIIKINLFTRRVE
jgi:hypothetical protein